MVVLNKKPLTAEVDGGALTPSTKKLIAVPLRMFAVRISLKETIKVSTVSPCMNVQSRSVIAGSKPLIAVQSTVPGEVYVET